MRCHAFRMSPTPDVDVVADLAATSEGAAPAPSGRDGFSWDLDGDVLRDLLMRTAG